MRNSRDDSGVGARIRDARKNSKLTQKELAERVGVHPNHLALIEQGRKKPSVGLLERIAQATNTAFAWAPVVEDPELGSKTVRCGCAPVEKVIDIIRDQMDLSIGVTEPTDLSSFPKTNWQPDYWCFVSLGEIDKWAFDLSLCMSGVKEQNQVDPNLHFAKFIANVVFSNDLIRTSTKYTLAVPNAELFNMFLKQIPVVIGNVSLVLIDVEAHRVEKEVYLCTQEERRDIFSRINFWE